MANVSSYNLFIQKDENNNINPLISATKKGDINSVKLLLENGCHVDDEDDKGRTALFYASAYKNIELLKLLFEYNCNVNHVDELGCNVLFYTISNSDYDITNFLLENGANINIQSNTGENLLILIIFKITESIDNKSLLRLAFEYNINVNVQDSDGNTALHIVTLSDRLDLLFMLLKQKPDQSILDKNGKTYIELAENKIKQYLSYYSVQKNEISKHPDLITAFYKAGILNDVIIKEYPDLFSGTELNIL